MSATASASASTSTNAPSTSHSIPGPSASGPLSSDPASTSPSTLPHSPETIRQIAEARTALEASMLNIGTSLDHTLRTRAQTLHANSAQLTRQEKDVAKATDALRKETDKLRKIADEGQRKVKELGNVQNWAEMLERDFLVVEETLRLVRNGNRPREGGSGDYEGSDWETSRSGSSSGSWSGSESEGEGERDDESIAGDLRRGKVVVDEQRRGSFGRRISREETVERSVVVDGEGDIVMDGVEVEDKGKGREEAEKLEEHIQPLAEPKEESMKQFVEPNTQHEEHLEQQEQQADTHRGSSTVTATDSSGSDPPSSSVTTAPSSSSVHTTESTMS